MVFYKIDALRVLSDDETKEPPTRAQVRAITGEIAEKSESLFQKSDQQNLIFTVSIGQNVITFGAICKTNQSVEKQFIEYANAFPFEIEKAKIEEVTFGAIRNMLSCAYRNDYIGDDDEVLDAFEIGALTSNHPRCEFGEALVDAKKGIAEINKSVDNLLFGETLLPEIERIYMGGRLKRTQGHPVHYIVQTDDRDVRRNVYKNLLSALYENGRLKNQRYCFLDYNENSPFPGAAFNALYRSCEGGAVIIRYESEDSNDGTFASRSSGVIAAICEIAVRYKNKVLTIICLPKGANKLKEEFLSNWGSTAFIELYEDIVFGEKACAYLKNKAKDNHIRSDKKLTNQIHEERGYTAAELNRIFDEWYSNKLCNDIYPQYKTSEKARAKVREEKPKGQAYQKLQNLIGLEKAKEVMNQALGYFKAQKLFADRGLKNEQPSMHMVFTGNPGTAKTTVARLFAEIMKENGLLSSGEICEVGRADLVGKFVGHTAPLVKSAFKRAKGGVLFIDEAYSLVDDRDGMYGDEAINTIVQEMENNRKDTVVIFAGYPDKMEGFLNKNPGLRSRIAFHIPFDDYSTDELCEISELIARENGFELAGGVKEKLGKIFDTATKRSDFGNGRYVRNIIERAKMVQANRLVNMDYDKITDSDIFTLCAEDIELPADVAQEKVIKIGFTA